MMRSEQEHRDKNHIGRAQILRCYFASGGLFFINGYMERLKDSFHVIGKYLSFLMILWVWHIIWGMVPDAVLGGGLYNHANLVWYIAITECIIFCGGHLFYDAYMDIKSGAIEQMLMRPVSYQFRAFAQWYGKALGQATVFFPMALLSAYFITGEWVMDTGRVALAAVMTMGALFCVVSMNYMVALTALWIREAAPAYWIVQKLCFLLGGLLFPITLYPEMFYDIAKFLPFAAVFFFPGTMALNVLPFGAGALIAIEVFWMFALYGLSVLIHGCALRHIGKYGA
tara:strand:- start:56402 stop:57253 length:852 start_codon:yes stop_codon:yes gene_type:complete